MKRYELTQANSNEQLVKSFRSIRQAALYLKLPYTSLYRAVRDHTIILDEYYISEVQEAIEPLYQPRASAKRLSHFELEGTTILQHDKRTGLLAGRYNTITEASRATGISDASISQCLRGKSKSAGGFIWTVDAPHSKE